MEEEGEDKIAEENMEEETKEGAESEHNIDEDEEEKKLQPIRK